MRKGREREILAAHLSARGLRAGRARLAVLEAFLATERHVTAEELHHIVQRRHRSCGVASVYRTLRVMCECGLGRELRLEGGAVRFEHAFDHRHHDHLCCLRCGALIEIADAPLERLQDRLCRAHGFRPLHHRLEVYGVCADCGRRGPSDRRVAAGGGREAA
jgi:Fur family ferric uptake transcriptional regulator